MRYNEEREGKASTRAQLQILPPNFFKFTRLTTPTPKLHVVVLKVLTENQVFYFTKWAFGEGTTCSMCLK